VPIAEETLLVTRKGILPFSAFIKDKQHRRDILYPVGRDMFIRALNNYETTFEGYLFFGKGEAIRITTLTGYSVIASPDQRVRIVNSTGNYSWRRMESLQGGDWVVLQMNSYPDYVDDFSPTLLKEPLDDEDMVLPTRLTQELAEWLGYFLFRGILFYPEKDKKAQIGFIYSNEKIKNYLIGLTAKLFGISDYEKIEGLGLHSAGAFGYQSNTLFKWLISVGLLGSEGIPQIPSLIFRGGRKMIYPFLRGAFSACCLVEELKNKRVIKLYSPYIDLIRELQILLLSIGIPTIINTSIQDSDYLFTLYVITKKGLKNFRDNIGFFDSPLSNALEEINLLNYAPEKKIGGLREIYEEDPKNLKSRSQTDILRIKRLFTDVRVMTLSKTLICEVFNENHLYDQVISIEKTKAKLYEPRLIGKRSFVGNGFVFFVE